MAWVPLIVASRRSRYRKRSGAGIILALLIFFLMFGVMFFMLFDWRNNFMPSMWVVFSGFGGFLIIIGICLAITAVTSQSYKKPVEKTFNPSQTNSQNQPGQVNPYKIHSIEQREKEELQSKHIKQESTVVFENNYCRFCGSKIEKDAIYCSQCGIKL